ncbi:LOW QUALITY PROTEIN: probable protein arginine N-methyltransferase 3 [Actinidia eriantha]|uniref:LOW QUALITY PROTEIN: probable protein arginine N-methyltransferase 3 n=1 Tax=Actinidia eriantha TaxID=165200 RepID=UPI002589A3F4|nr:LOW QUALITY PROTEIN: probable protein arginine N-methyltransferase 3 [Actinidia eriantha]
MPMATENQETSDVELDSEVEVEEEEQGWGDWNADDDEGEDDLDSDSLCLFCNSKYSSSDALFDHCNSIHHFDFHGIRKALGLDFYGSFKLINYVRSQVAEDRCWSCRFTCSSKRDLQNHLHEAFCFKDVLPWDDEKYLKPFLQEDSLLYSFGEEDCEEEYTTSVNKVRELINFDDANALEGHLCDYKTSCENGKMENGSTSNRFLNMNNPSHEVKVNDVDVKEACCSDIKSEDRDLSCAKMATPEIKNVNKNYFGLYSSFGIHREMISDKIRTDAYRQAILNNPSLLSGAAVLDVGCGTGILSLFAAQAGASSVIAVEASDKMATVATQVAKDNGLLCRGSLEEGISQCTGVMKVVQGMVEELGNCDLIQPHSIDVLLSEWMGYCLLYESMLSSVLFARDRWLKPGGAILPDTATMFVAGFGRGGTSIPFWENVYGFNMSCIGKELVEDAARVPIVDVVDSCDIVTNTAILQSFDLLTMTPDEMDFTSRIELEPQLDNPKIDSTDSSCRMTWCYGVVLWFETGFTSRFCKEMPIVLSTSPYTPKTHWSQTSLTFREPIAIALAKPDADRFAAVGTEACPAVKIYSRISIARASPHRSVDISLEISGICPDGRKRSWPVQIFNLS